MVFTRNQLCLLTSDKLHVVPATVLGTLLRPEVRLGTSTPGADPAGDYAWAFFRLAEAQQPGAYAQLDAKALKLSGGPASPQPPAGRSAYAWLMDEGRADAYLTYCTNAVAARREVPRLQVVQLPPGLAVGADYGLTVRADAPAAAAAVRQGRAGGAGPAGAAWIWVSARPERRRVRPRADLAMLALRRGARAAAKAIMNILLVEDDAALAEATATAMRRAAGAWT